MASRSITAIFFIEYNAFYTLKGRNQLPVIASVEYSSHLLYKTIYCLVGLASVFIWQLMHSGHPLGNL